jgi:hypothetical protein
VPSAASAWYMRSHSASLETDSDSDMHWKSSGPTSCRPTS